jgi:integrase
MGATMGRKAQWPPKVFNHPCGQERVVIRGRAYYLGPIGSLAAKERYVEIVRKCEAEGLHLPCEPPPRKGKGGLTVAEVVERFQLDAKARYDPAGREAKQFGYSIGPLLDVCGAMPAARFGVQDLERVRDEMIRRSWSRGVINRRVIRLRTLWRWAEQKGLAPAGSWDHLRALAPLPRNDRRVRTTAPRQACSWRDLARVCRFCPATVRDLLLVLYYTGARPSELRKLKAGMIADRTAEVWLADLEQHKNAWRGQGRLIAFGPKAQAVLSRRLAGLTADEYVFASSPGRCYSGETLGRAVARACERAGVKITAYEARHAYKQRVTARRFG